MRFDPFRELDRLAEQTLSAGARAAHSLPMEALRRGDELMVQLDVPGVLADNIDLTVERNVVSVRVHREPARQEGDEVIISERVYGDFTRQLFLGENLDIDRMTADTRDGVLTLTIPVSEKSKPRRIPLGGTAGTDQGAMTTGQGAMTTGQDTMTTGQDTAATAGTAPAGTAPGGIATPAGAATEATTGGTP
jgi:HSP20 family protein